MKFQLISTLGAAVAATALFGICDPARAVSLAGSSDLNSTEGFSFAEDTEVTFTFLESHGEFLSAFGIYDASKNLLFELFPETQASDNGDVNDWEGTCGVSVPGACEIAYVFEAGVDYFFGLVSQGEPTVFSGTQFNNQLPFQFSNTPDDGTAVLIAVNDSDTTDSDYNDFIISANVVESETVPEPGIVGAVLAVGALGLISQKSKERRVR